MGAPTELYFTFADLALRYDCAACGQRCCRGAGFAFAADELVPLLRRAPKLAPHLALRGGGSFYAVDLTERCWLLDGRGFCELEVAHGRAAKPSTCRLFPFNRLFRVGTVRVVDVNGTLCPIEAAPPGGGVAHAELAAEIAALEGSPLVDVPAWLPSELPGDWLARERAASRAAAAGADLPAVIGMDPSLAARRRAAWARVHGVAEAELSSLEAGIVRSIALLAPSLRWNAIFRQGAPAYPRTILALPDRLLGLGLCAALAARGLGSPPSLRGIQELWRGQSAVIDVLARWDEPVKLAAPRFEADLPDLLQPALGALLGGAFRGGRSLGELVEGAAASLPTELRPLAVALAARQLDVLLPGVA